MEEIAKDQHQLEEEEEIIIQDEEVEELKRSLQKTSIMGGKVKLINYQGFWYPEYGLKNIVAFQNHFLAKDSDLIIASSPKTGNTWLKPLLFAIVNRSTQDFDLLHQRHPHELVYLLDDHLYGNAFEYPQPRHLNQLPPPRLFQTHLPYHSLPESIRASGCRILYLTRNPLDTFVSMFYFTLSIARNLEMGGEHHECGAPISIEEFVEECCCQGTSVGGPFFDHVLGYWNKSLEQPNKMMFLMYEDLNDDSIAQVKNIAEFVGFPFTSQEECEGVVANIIQVCSFKSLKELDVNQSGCINNIYEKKSFFRKGEVGDWRNHLRPQMVDSLMKYVQEKIDGSGLVFKFI